MKYKIKKDYYHRVDDNLILIPEGTLIEKVYNRYEVEIDSRKVQLKKSLLDNNPEVFEPIEEKMTWGSYDL
jgi:hypothetical protein